MCLSRQVAWSNAPTMWGNPPAQLVENACMANGDDYCRAWTGVNDLAMAPAAIAFIASALLNFSLRRTAVMLVVALGGPSLSLACGVGHG